MWVYENLEMCIGGIFVAGIAEHFLRRWRHRRRYQVLRQAFERAVRTVRATEGDPAAVVRCAELERDFMRAWWLGWSFGLGARARGMLKLCAALTLLAFILKGPIERHESRRNRGFAGASSAIARGHAAAAADPLKAVSASGHGGDPDKAWFPYRGRVGQEAER
jgi:hypothetical protein